MKVTVEKEKSPVDYSFTTEYIKSHVGIYENTNGKTVVTVYTRGGNFITLFLSDGIMEESYGDGSSFWRRRKDPLTVTLEND